MSQPLLQNPQLEAFFAQLTAAISEQQLVKLLCTSLPVVIKECCTKGMTPQQVMSAYLKRHSSFGGNQLELMTKKQTRLTTLWQTNSVISHLQLCTVAVALATEQEQAKVSSL